ncbi:Tyrosine recombinase XerC [Sporomusa silvacetica DSM 10669]|uniref:Tyrosine recombinase XerC n=1 Tax=Sporomusa silvacetica DSM 10669 TaxID=1123289 RepID=A0ABZ3IJM5_9FIRM|nr:site-specific integrase [Sporomusa silvacetica]OZC18730.1 putative prophage phiRv2 integrase [Sporomusa silvacetica DSM 10669]
MAKRDSGEGTIVKWDEKKQLFFQRFGYKDKTGKNKVKAIYGKSKGEVNEKRKAWQKELDAGINTNSAKMTYEAWLRIWLDTYKKGSIEQTTLDNYQQYVTLHIIPGLGSMKLKDLTRQNIQVFINDMSEKLSSGSVVLIRAIISNSLKIAVEDDILLKNPATGIKILKRRVEQTTEIKPFSVEELKTIFSILGNGKYYNIAYVAAFTGMRRGEVLGLRWTDIDFSAKIIRVRQQIKYIHSKKELIAGRLKTENAYREIPLDDKVIAVLKKQSAWQAANKLKLGNAYTDSGLVFTDELGGMLKPINISVSFGYAVKKAKAGERSFHDLRHTFASVAISSGVSVKAISATMGHANIQETLDTYGHLMPGDSYSVTSIVAKYLSCL